MPRTRVVLALFLLATSLTGAVLSFLGVLDPKSILLVIQLSWAAIYIEAFNTLQVAHQDRKKAKKEEDQA